MPETYGMNDFRRLGDQNGYYPPQYVGGQPAAVHGRTPSTAPILGREPHDRGARTPSPTPSEMAALNGTSNGVIPWDKIKSTEFWLSPKGICKYHPVIVSPPCTD